MNWYWWFILGSLGMAFWVVAALFMAKLAGGNGPDDDEGGSRE